MLMLSGDWDAFLMRCICTSASIPPWGISPQQSLKVSGDCNKCRSQIFTNDWQISVQSDGGSTPTTAIGMDLSGYGYPNVFANDYIEQQKLKSLGIKYLRLDLKYSTPGDPTSKMFCSAIGCDTQWTGDQWVQAIKAIGAQPLIIVPYGTVDAANMVKHFNKDTNNYVRYWIVGNEPDQAGISAATYSTNFNRDFDAMIPFRFL